jgi:hypothetical protein
VAEGVLVTVDVVVAVWLAVVVWEPVAEGVLETVEVVVAVRLFVAVWEPVAKGVLVTVDVLLSVWLPVPKNVAVSLGVLVAVPVWLPVLDWLTVVVCKPRLEGVTVSVAVDVLALGWTSGSKSALVGASALASNSGAASRPTAISISVSRLVAKSVLRLGVSPGSVTVAASGTATKGVSSSAPESGLAGEGEDPSSRNPPVAPVCKSSRHAGQVNTKRARSHLVEPKSSQRVM